MADEMSYDGDRRSGKRSVPALVVIIAGIIFLNVVANYDAGLAVSLAVCVIVIAALTFLIGVILGVIRRK